MSLAELNAESQQAPPFTFVRALRPHPFILQPDAYPDLRVVARVPRGTAVGSYFVNAEASAAVPGSGGPIDGAVAGTLEVDVSAG